jgi:hypothetical protein
MQFASHVRQALTVWSATDSTLLYTSLEVHTNCYHRKKGQVTSPVTDAKSYLGRGKSHAQVILRFQYFFSPTHTKTFCVTLWFVAPYTEYLRKKSHHRPKTIPGGKKS